MNIVITSTGNNLEAQFDLRFGRASFFCVYNEDTKQVDFVENKNKDAQGGAGTKTAEKMVELEIKKIISGDFGPKAKEMLEKFNIQMVIFNDDSQTIQNIIDKINS